MKTGHNGKTTISVDFIYVNYNSYNDVIKSIASLKKLILSSGLNVSVYIADNSFVGTSPQFIIELSSFAKNISTPGFYVTYQPCDSNIGFGAACNKATSFSSSPIIAFANCDTDFSTCDPDSFLKMLNLLQDERIAVVGPKVISETGLLHASCFSFDPISILLKPTRHIRKVGSRIKFKIPYYSSFKHRIDRITYEGMDKTTPTIVDWVSGCFAIVRRDFFTHVSGFDERYFLYFEDVDLCRKARQFAKLVVFDPRVTIIHRASHQSASNRGVLRSILFNHVTRYHIFSWLKYCFKWHKDFLEKLSVVIGSLPVNRARYRTPAGYNLDFSCYKPLFKE